MKGTSGQKQSESFAWYDRSTHSWKTSQVSLLTNTFDEFSETWPKAGTMQNGMLSERTTLGRTIEENGSGFWRSPSAGDGDHGGPNARDKSGHLHLSAQVHYFPTPTVQDAENNGSQSQMERNTLPLNAVVKLFRSPNSTDWKNRGTAEYREGRQIQLQTQVGGQLSPVWVEWLQNFPLGWTGLRPLVMLKFQRRWLTPMQNYLKELLNER